MSLSHHSAAAAKHKELTDLLQQANKDVIKKRKAWKLDPSDSVRFEFQKALSLVDRLEKELWKFQ